MVSGSAKRKKRRDKQLDVEALLACEDDPGSAAERELKIKAINEGIKEEVAKRGISVRITEERGRVCVAATDLEPGRVLIEEDAYVHGNGHDGWCLECDEEHDPGRCSVVAQRYPEEVVCRMEELEDFMCGLERVQTLDRARAWLKCLSRARGDNGGVDALLPLTACNLKECVRDAALLAKRYPSLFPQTTNGPSIAQAGRMLAVLNTNSHELEELGGSGLFAKACLFEHSCVPNCAFSTVETTVRVCTLVPVPAGTPLSIDYTNSYCSPVDERQETLQTTYGFTCTCAGCTSLPDRARAFTCPTEKCEGPVCPTGSSEAGGPWACVSCSRPATPAEIAAYETAEAAVLSAGPTGVHAADAVLRSTPLHHTHFAVIGALESGAEAVSHQPGSEKEAVHAWERVLSSLRTTLPPYHSELAIMYDKLAQVRVVAGDIEGAHDAYRHAYQVACLSTGPGWVPTMDLASLIHSPPTSRQGLLDYFSRRPRILRELKEQKGKPCYPGPYPRGFTRDFTRVCHDHLTPSTMTQLEAEGFVVIDGALGEEWSTALRDEVMWLAREGYMAPNRTQFGSKTFAKPHVTEADLYDDTLRRRVPELAALLEDDSMTDAIADAVPALRLVRGIQGRSLKVQRNAGWGACFPWHHDNPGRPNKRALTGLVYLNEHWREGDGGELVLMPFLRPKVTIAPTFGRIVLFRSDRVLHRVLPSHHERLCLTVWVDGHDVNTDEDVQLRLAKGEAEDVQTLADRLRLSPSHRVLARAVYEEEYENSLRECMLGAPGEAEMMASHTAHMRQSRSNVFSWPLIEKLRAIRDDVGKGGGGVSI